ncbi:protein PNS1-like [Olea europaea var. sylvestris]|uniref:protein PNS1-like n=1 Tax=Olea europaea var. sylvestris TaxID=158386 RepID=UPI000C1D080D|nr:protein PNS1-like [Olea europaea var. sylvestris]
MYSLCYAVTTSFGSIFYGSLFTAAMRTLRWEIAVYGKSFNNSAKDAWELFQSTGVEALVAYDCSGAVLLMDTFLGGLIARTCAGVWSCIICF